jgi:catechol 2,3-dioxygenase-like lactoylglutathione lyase family enzyme
MPNVTFGIDHPVVTVRDLASAREQYRRLGFAPNPVGFHPWGTTLSLLMFEDNFIELISVHDASKFGANSVDGFCYGREVGNFLRRTEGLGLLALHSRNARADHHALTGRGLASQGLIDFRREMVKPDGSPDVAIVSLGLFLNERQRDVSYFICHQHRPELIWVPQWQQHPNGVHAVTAVTYVAERPAELVERHAAIYGPERLIQKGEGFEADSGCGLIRVVTIAEAIALFGGVSLPDWRGDDGAHGIAITVSTSKFDELEPLWRANGITHAISSHGRWVIPPDQCGNVILAFERLPGHSERPAVLGESFSEDLPATSTGSFRNKP